MTAADAAPCACCYFNRSYWPDTGATGQLLTELAEDLVRDPRLRGHRRHGLSPGESGGTPAGPIARDPERRARIVRAAGTTLSTAGGSSDGRCNYVTYFRVGALGSAAAAAAGCHGRADRSADHRPRGAGGAAALRDGLLLPGHLSRGRRRCSRTSTARWSTACSIGSIGSCCAAPRRVIALGDTMAQRLVEGKGADPARITVIHNWADTVGDRAVREAQPVCRRPRPRRSLRRAARRQHRDVAESRRGDRRGRAASRRPDILVLFIGDGNRRRGARRARRPRTRPRATSASCPSSRAISCAGPTRRATSAWCRSSRGWRATSCRASSIRSSPPAGPYVAAVEASSEVAALTARHDCGVLVTPGDAEALAARSGARARSGTPSHDGRPRPRAAVAALRARSPGGRARARVVARLAGRC